VVRPAEADLLDQRTAAQAAYKATLAVADGWALPRTVRDALRAWQFGTAEELLASDRQVLAERSALEADAKAAGVTLPDTVQTLFEAGSLQAAIGEAQAERSAIAAISAASAHRTTGGDIVTAVGMIGEDPAHDLASAESALASGDDVAALAAADAASKTWSGAHDEGRRRLLMVTALALAAGALGLSLASRVRRMRRARRRPVPFAAP